MDHDTLYKACCTYSDASPDSDTISHTFLIMEILDTDKSISGKAYILDPSISENTTFEDLIFGRTLGQHIAFICADTLQKEVPEQAAELNIVRNACRKIGPKILKKLAKATASPEEFRESILKYIEEQE